MLNRNPNCRAPVLRILCRGPNYRKAPACALSSAAIECTSMFAGKRMRTRVFEERRAGPRKEGCDFSRAAYVLDSSNESAFVFESSERLGGPFLDMYYARFSALCRAVQKVATNTLTFPRLPANTRRLPWRKCEGRSLARVAVFCYTRTRCVEGDSRVHCAASAREGPACWKGLGTAACEFTPEQLAEHRIAGK